MRRLTDTGEAGAKWLLRRLRDSLGVKAPEVGKAREEASEELPATETQPERDKILKLETEVADLRKKLQAMTEHAEGHAVSVRSLIGQRMRLVGLLGVVGDVVRQKSDLGLEPVLKSLGKTGSQFYQDIVCLVLNNGKRGGFFVEFGACDGIVISNSLLLEQEFGWSGILCEPGRQWHEQLRKNRTCMIDERCVWARTGEEIEFTEADNLLEASTNVKVMQSPATETYTVPTVSLGDLLDDHQAPELIDFLSMDVEGAEYEILQTVPFERYRFDFCAIEHHTLDQETAIKAFMEGKGYVQIYREISGHDGFYVPKDRVGADGPE